MVQTHCNKRDSVPLCVLLVRNAIAVMHICHCCYQVSVLCNILEVPPPPHANTCDLLQHARCFDSRPTLYISLKHLLYVERVVPTYEHSTPAE